MTLQVAFGLMSIRITDHDRRERLVTRHHLARTASTVDQAATGVVAMHSSDPASPYLAGWARVGGFTLDDLDRALYERRTLWRLHAMRRTLFVVPATDAAVFDAGAGRAIAARERTRLSQWLTADMSDSKASKLVEKLEDAVLELLADGVDHRTADLAEAVPDLRTEITVGAGKWAGRVPMSSRLLYILAMERKIVRARPAGSWRSSQYHWALAETWFGEAPVAIESERGRAELLSRYLASYGPVTLTDIRWWTGWTAREAHAALEAGAAERADLDASTEGFVAIGDGESPAPARPVVALLPGLDSTPMGWKERSWYLGDHAGPLFDRNGNVGPTVWLDGRIVGGWGLRPDGDVAWRLLEDIGREATLLVEAEAGNLTAWLDGTVVLPRFRTPLERELSA